ncbi:AAA family ATPase [Candidatus Saccharibacteria bacterium]|nr:AAA family ATPase [Candidatus Saccharibacteria bacterium]
MNPAFSDLLLSQRTRQQSEDFTARPANALLISGSSGSGKSNLAHALASRLLETDSDRLAIHPHFHVISKPETKSEIPIESVRGLLKKMELRVASSSNSKINRVAIIENAHFLSTEAQNALLKLLEEPPLNSMIILTAYNDESLLPTVTSRTQNINITPPSLVQAVEYFDNYPRIEVERAYRLSRGSTSLLEALLSDKDEHSLKIGVNQAKAFIAADTYSRLIQLQTITKDRQDFLIFLDALARVLSALNEESLKNRRHVAAARILESRKSVELAFSQASVNTNIRLIALRLVQNTKI